MSTAATVPVEPQIQTVPTEAGTPPTAPVQPRDESGRFVSPQPAPPPTPAPVTQPAPAPAAPAAPQPYTVTDIGNGQVEVKFADLPEVYRGTQAEILPKITEALYNTKKWAQQRQAAPAQPVAQPQTPASPFKTPEDAQAADYVTDLVAKSFGFENAKQMRERIGNTVTTSQDYLDNQLSIQFQAANRDYNPTAENSEKLVMAIVNAGFGDLYENGTQEQRLNLMNMAHAHLIKSGAYQPMPQNPNPANPVIPPPPIPQGRSPQDFGTPQNADVNLSQAQLLALLEQQRRIQGQ